jgi:uncharacterized protein (TIGR02217 family)
MSFLETPRFPEDISYGSAGGPLYNTLVIQVSSGHEKRNINWVQPLYRFDVSYGVRTSDLLYDLTEFFHVVVGKAYGFRFKDFADYKSTSSMSDTLADTDQLLGVGDNAEVDFQLIKTYTKGALDRERNIKKPVTGTTVVSLDDVSQGSGWTIDTTTGIITFAVAPGASVDVKAGFEFDVPVRFDSDELRALWVDESLQSTEIMISETRL